MTKYRIIKEWDYDCGGVRYWIQKKYWYGWDYFHVKYPAHSYYSSDAAEEALRYYFRNKDLRIVKEFEVE